MSLNFSFTLVVSFAIFFIGLVVYLHDRKSLTNFFFFLIAAATVFWSFANFFSVTVRPEEALYWIRLVLFFAAPHSIFFLFFTLNFPSRTLSFRRRYAALIGGALALAMGISLSPFVFSGAIVTGTGAIPTPGALMPVFAAIVLGSLISGIVLMVRKYKRAEDAERVRWRAMLIGVGASYILLVVTNFILVVLFKDTTFVIFAPLFMIPAIAGIAYAILRHGLLNVKAIATEIFTFFILSVSLLDVITAEGIKQMVFHGGIFVFFLTFGMLLIKSVVREVEQREKLQILTEELSAANEKLKELDRMKSEFLSFASHQVKSPLAVIKGYAALILEGGYGKIPQAVAETVLKIKNSSDQMIALVNNLLDLRKIEEGRMEYAPEEVEISKFVSDVVEGLRPLAEAKKLTLSFASSAEGLRAKIDKQKFYQVIQNFVDNSIKYTESGFVKVEVAPRDDKKSVRVSISDSGRGMSRELIASLFMQFNRDPSVKKIIQGTGLGLYIAKQIVIAHGGEVWAESVGEGKGSTFSVSVPYL